MKQPDRLISLGFTGEQFPAGTHICQIFGEVAEREETLLKFALSGLQAGERTACFSDKTTASVLSNFLADHGISYPDCAQSGQISIAKTHNVYFEGGCFKPERMLTLLTELHQKAMDNGYPGARVIGEMTPEICEVSGGDRLLEYESRVSLLLEQHPVTAVCQYDATAFDGGTIMDVLTVHPLMVVRRMVVRNPFYIPAREFLNTRCHMCE